MVSCWTIHLCLQAGDLNRFRIFNGRWSECLGQREEYPYNEKTEEFRIPKRIRGIKVEFVDDDIILGGELIWHCREDMIEFDDLKAPELEKWLDVNKWKLSAIRRKLTKEMKSLKGRVKKEMICCEVYRWKVPCGSAGGLPSRNCVGIDGGARAGAIWQASRWHRYSGLHH
jgi:hypothetical protein